MIEAGDARARIHNALDDLVDRPESLILSWFAIAAYREDGDGEDGVTRYYIVSPEGTPSYIVRGLAAEAVAWLDRDEDER